MNFKNIFERLQKAWIFSSLLSIVLGIILLFFPSITIQVVCYLLGGLAILYGIGRVIRYTRQSEVYAELFRGDLMIGLFLIAIGLFIVFRIEFVAGFIPVIFGIALLASGIGGVQRSMDAKRAGYERWVALLLMAALTRFIQKRWAPRSTKGAPQAGQWSGLTIGFSPGPGSPTRPMISGITSLLRRIHTGAPKATRFRWMSPQLFSVALRTVTP